MTAWHTPGMSRPCMVEVGEQRAVGAKTILFHLPSRIPAQKIAVEHGGGAAAAAAAHVHILPLQIVEQQPAVLVSSSSCPRRRAKEVRDDLVPEPAEIAGDDEIVVRG